MTPATPPAHRPADKDTTGTDSAGRLWFHLDEVVPLAVHAVSTPRHGLTAAGLLAGAPLLPALIWQAQPDGDPLTSNGVPGWYGRDGREHAARARRWQRPATTGSGTTGIDRCGFLPLRSAPSAGFHVIDWLQQAVNRGAHWLSINPTRRPMISPGQLDVSDQRGDLYPPDATWVEATVACVPLTGSGSYPALVADGYHSNHGGGVLARFDRVTAVQMMDDLHQARRADGYRPDSYPVLRWSDDRIEVFAENIDGLPGLRRYDVIGPDPDGRYPLGAHLWPWLRLDNR
ncbi:hypothetical protein [Actinoplanes sp. NPDC026623]|uniref:hypothetical protein n=1 Tax=Actinoplanes sp. NPDC026623 TaxID=3155610 RepID=UPI0033CF3BF8